MIKLNAKLPREKKNEVWKMELFAIPETVRLLGTSLASIFGL